MSDEALKPCPFCGARFTSLITSHGWQVICAECGAHGPNPAYPSGPGRTRDEKMAAAWNRRAAFPQPGSGDGR